MPRNIITVSSDQIFSIADMDNNRIRAMIKARLADEKGRREAAKAIADSDPDSFVVSEEKFLSGRIFNRDVKYGSDWY